MMTGNEARPEKNVMTRSDGAALCALDPPTLKAGMSPRLPDAPPPVRCGMTCADDAQCKHFNYVSTESSPCQLYHYRPTTFDVVPNCHHYHEPGQQKLIIHSRSYTEGYGGSTNQSREPQDPCSDTKQRIGEARKTH